MNRRFGLVLVLCSTLALFCGLVPSRAEVATPVADDGSPPGPQLQVIVCPDPTCLECGHPGLICCLPNRQCVIVWMPIWFRTSAAVPLETLEAVSHTPACPASTTARPWYGEP